MVVSWKRLAAGFRLALCGGMIATMLVMVTPPPMATAAASPQQSRKIKTPTREAATVKRRAAAPKADAARDLLVYHGGPVLNVPQIFLSFWGPEWTSSSHQPAVTYMEGFLGNLGGSPWLGLNTEYCSGSLPPPATSCTGTNYQRITNPAAQLNGVWNDSTPVSYATPGQACGLSSQIEAGDCDVMLAAGRAASHFGSLPTGAVIAVMTPSRLSQPGFVSNGWCAYHWSVQPGRSLQGSGLPYAYVPFAPDVGAACGQNSVNQGPAGVYDGLSILSGHEYAEAITDPFPASGWVDTNGQENADKCIWVNDSAIDLGGARYAVQSNWSNAADRCVLPRGPNPTPPTAFEPLGGILTSAADATSWGSDRLDVVARGTDNGLWHRWRDGTNWSGWEPLSGVLTSDPGVVSWGPGRLDIFVRGSDDGLWHKWWDGTAWSAWTPLGGILTSGPDVASWGPGRLDIVVRGTDNGLWHRWWDGGAWSEWEPLGGVLSADPAVAAGGGNRLDVFVRGSDNGLWHRWSTGAGWHDWESLGGSLSSGPDAATSGPGRIDVFALSSDHALLRLPYGGAGGAWASLGGSWSSDPSVASRGSSSLDVLVRGADDGLWHATVPD